MSLQQPVILLEDFHMSKDKFYKRMLPLLSITANIPLIHISVTDPIKRTWITLHSFKIRCYTICIAAQQGYNHIRASNVVVDMHVFTASCEIEGEKYYNPEHSSDVYLRIRRS
jgi:hypothetical protein